MVLENDVVQKLELSKKKVNKKKRYLKKYQKGSDNPYNRKITLQVRSKKNFGNMSASEFLKYCGFL